MARRRKETKVDRTPSVPSPSPQKVVHLENQMRGLIEAARAPRARRFVTPSKVQERINALIQREAFPYAKKTDLLLRNHDSKRRQAPLSANRIQQRSALHKSELLRARLPKQVRNVFLGAERALECTRRETRREVMFALHRTGKGGRKNRKARWSADSRISCKGR